MYLSEYLSIKDANFHALRHTFSTRMIENGVDFKTLSVLLGHANPSITMNRYAHSLPNTKVKAMNSIASLYETPE
ncbi:MAG TPA: tyrosine-type recombinase/integrase [Ruminiclostridium sp.]